MNFGNCPLADGGEHDVESIAGHPCEFRDSGECRIEPVTGGGIIEKTKENMRVILLAIAAVTLVAGVGYAIYLYFDGPRCEAPDVRKMMVMDPRVAELETDGLACLKAGLRGADADKLSLGIAALRAADLKGSAKAQLALGRMFDPGERASLENEVKDPKLLPAPDAVLAVGFYDRAAKAGNAAAAAAAAKLRASVVGLPGPDGSRTGRNGGPLNVPGYDDIYQRVLIKPGALLASVPGGVGTVSLPVFGVYYVFASRPDAMQIGASLDRGAEGWVRDTDVQPFNSMLAMRYEPPGQRAPVLFFKDELSVAAMIGQPGAKANVEQLIKSVQAGNPDPRLIAIEQRAIDWVPSPYVMPILGATLHVADDGRNVYVARIASVSGGAASGSKVCTETSKEQLKHRIAFAIDTTASMGPYIDGVKRIARAWQTQIDQRGLNDKFRFGVVAFRNNMDSPAQAGLEYVTNPVLPFKDDATAARFASTVTGLSASPVSTHSFNEDSVAGLTDALGYDWSDACGVKVLFLITDAGALGADDPKAREKGKGLASIAAIAQQQNIRVFVVHIATPEARRAGNIEPSAEQYRAAFGVSGAGGYKVGGYAAIPDGSPAAFSNYISKIGGLIDAIDKERQGNTQQLPTASSDTLSFEEQLLTELFSVQQRFLGTAAGAQAKTFTESYTSDRDLANLDRPALQVSVLLTRRQLSTLLDQTERLIRNARTVGQQVETGRFFQLLQMVSAATSQDPARLGGNVARLEALMPSFLKLLPYKSAVLSLSAEDWRTMGASKQNEFITSLSEKAAFYRSLAADNRAWRDPSGSRGDPTNPGVAERAVALVPLAQLP